MGQEESRPYRPEDREVHSDDIDCIIETIEAAEEIKRVHRSSILLISSQTHRYRLMRFPELPKESVVRLWAQHIEEISQNEFIVSNFLIDERMEPLVYRQFYDIYAEAADFGIEQPSSSHAVRRLLEMGGVDTSLVADTYKTEVSTRPDMKRSDVFTPADDKSFSRIYSDITWLRNNLYHG